MIITLGFTESEQPRTPPPGYLDLAPTRTGYRTVARPFDAERQRVRRLRERLTEHLGQARTADEDERR